MMKISVLALTAGLTCALAAPSFGQSAPTIDRRVANMRRELGLTGPQAGTIRGDMFAASDEKRVINHNPNIGSFQKQQRTKEINRSTRQEIEAVLTPFQLRQYRAMLRGWEF
jgi:hypothetical protein